MMKNLKEEVLNNYQIRRGSKKDSFIDFICKNVDGFKIDKAKYLCENKNLVYGNIEDAKVLITAHYDTCANSLFPNTIFPEVKLIWTIMFGAIIGLVLGSLSGLFSKTGSILDIFLYLVELYIVYTIGIKPFFGKANRNNYNDNTSGVVAILSLIENNPDLIDKKVAFVLFDNEEYGLLGSYAFKKKHNNIIKDKLIINLDCISDGDNILVLKNKEASTKYETEIQKSFESALEGKQIAIKDSKNYSFTSDHMVFPMYIAIGAFNKTKKGNMLYLNKIHTNKDLVFDERNIELINECIINFIERI